MKTLADIYERCEVHFKYRVHGSELRMYWRVQTPSGFVNGFDITSFGDDFDTAQDCIDDLLNNIPRIEEALCQYELRK